MRKEVRTQEPDLVVRSEAASTGFLAETQKTLTNSPGMELARD